MVIEEDWIESTTIKHELHGSLRVEHVVLRRTGRIVPCTCLQTEADYVEHKILNLSTGKFDSKLCLFLPGYLTDIFRYILLIF